MNKKTHAYWDSIRPVPLEREEQFDYHIKDSIFQVTKDSALSKNAIDSLKKKQGKFKPLSPFWSGVHRNHYSATTPYNWSIESLIQNLEYNPAEGLVLNVYGGYNAYWKKWKTRVDFQPSVRYGFSNTHLNAWATVRFSSLDVGINKKPKQHSLTLGGGKRVSDFNKESSLPPLINSISVLFYGNNLIKTYENYFGSAVYRKRYDFGLQYSIGALFEDRIPLNNSTHFTIFKKDSARITPNYPNERIPAQFSRYQAFLLDLTVSFRPGQRYIQLPYNKISLGSKYPLFSLRYVKGIKGLLGSDVNFDKWQFSITDDRNFKLAGLLRYKLGVGGFFNTRSVFIQDFQHFNGNQSVAASEYLNSYQLAKYYANSTTASIYGVGHIEHHFNGLLTNKIPLINRFKWNLVAGSNAFYVNKDNNYVELFVGLENIFKILRVDAVWGFENGVQGHTGIRVGFGGILGGGLQVQQTSLSRNRSIGLF